MPRVGQLLEEPGRVSGVWQIPDVTSLHPDEYFSPKFQFLDTRWSLSFDHFPSGWLSLHLNVTGGVLPREVRYSFGIKNARGVIEESVSARATFSEQKKVYSITEYLMVSELQRRGAELAPSGILSICYILESVSKSSLFSRFQNLSVSFRNILNTQKRSDVKLKLKDGELSAHRIILESRSPVFERMFDVDLQESQTGEVDIEDATKDAFEAVLNYVYGGVPEGMSCENMCEVYKIAHKYEFEDLREFCTTFMLETLRMETVCDVMSVAHLYQEKALKVCVKEFFAKNKKGVFESEKWKILKKEDPSVVCEMVEWVLSEDV